MNNGLALASVLLCEDVLMNPAGRLTLYNTYLDLGAADFPAVVVRLHVVTTWYNPGDALAEFVVQVAIITPGDEETLVGDAAVTVQVAPGAYHTQVSRFRDLVLPFPGAYRVQVRTGTEVVSDLPLIVTAAPADVPPTPPASDGGGR
jgi:hypothetical protein